MFRKIGVSLLAALMLSSVAFAFDSSPAGTEKNQQENKKEERKVLKFDKEVVKKIMIQENGYSALEASVMTSGLRQLDAKLQPILDSYLANRSLYTDFNIDGITIKDVMEWYGCGFWDGISLMDYYVHKPELAKDVRGWSPYRDLLK